MDPNPDILNIQETALSCFYGGKVLSSFDTKNAEEIIRDAGRPEMVIADSSFLVASTILADGSHNFPIIVCADNYVGGSLKDRYPSVAAVIEKPLSTTAFTYMVKSISTIPQRAPTHIPIKFSILLKVGEGLFDLYLKLSDTNFVKVFHKGAAFTNKDVEKLKAKNVNELFIKNEDSAEFLKFLENQFSAKLNPIQEDVPLALENLELLEKISKRLGWTPEVMVSAYRTVSHAVKILSTNKQIIGILRKKLAEPSSPYCRHISLITYLVSAMGSRMEWVGESGQIKLALAALIHDATVDESLYENIKEWNKRARDVLDKSPEVVKYRQHPYEASKLAHSLDSISPDVDQIILRHHEAMDGSGFPRAVDASRIGPLPTLFIMVEDLVDFLDRGDDVEASISKYIAWGKENYTSGHFKKIFKGLEDNINI